MFLNFLNFIMQFKFVFDISILLVCKSNLHIVYIHILGKYKKFMIIFRGIHSEQLNLPVLRDSQGNFWTTLLPLPCRSMVSIVYFFVSHQYTQPLAWSTAIPLGHTSSLVTSSVRFDPSRLALSIFGGIP